MGLWIEKDLKVLMQIPPNFLFYKITSFHSAFVLEQQALIQCWISCEFSNVFKCQII